MPRKIFHKKARSGLAMGFPPGHLITFDRSQQPEILKLVIDLESSFASFSLDRQLNRRQVTMERFLSK